MKTWHPKGDAWSLANLTLEQKIGQMIMVRFPDPDGLRDMLVRGWAGSFYFSMKTQSAVEIASRLNDLQRVAFMPAFVPFGFACADCGTGLLKGHHMRIGATRSADIAYRFGLLETREQRAYGFHMPGMPVLDVNSEPGNPIINTRAISDDPALVTKLGCEILRGVLDGRGLTCTMHFPGHGATLEDSHIRVPLDKRPFTSLWDCDLRPYRQAIPRGLINAVCTNHIHYPALVGDPVRPATICPGIIRGLLRECLHYDGLVTSDSLTMKPMKDAYGIEEGAVLSVLAGHDVILQDYQSDPRITHRALVDAAESGRIPSAQIDASVRRILRYKKWLGLLDRPFVDLESVATSVRNAATRQLAVEIARQSVTLLEAAAIPWNRNTGSRCLLIANGRGAVKNTDMDVTHESTVHHFVSAVQRRIPTATVQVLSERMAPEEISAVEAAAADCECIVIGLFTRVLCYHEDSIGLPAVYRDLLHRLAGLGKPIAILNFGNPYIMADLPRPQAALCTYDEECPESYEAAAAVLFGESAAPGRLPVHVSPHYPFGHGIG